MTNPNKNNNEAIVNLVNGVGNDAVPFAYDQGDTVASILQKANIKLEHGVTVTLGRKRIKHPEKATVRPGDTLVIAGQISNGQLSKTSLQD